MHQMGPQLMRELVARTNPEGVVTAFLSETPDPDFVDHLGYLCEPGGWPDERVEPEYQVKKVEFVGGQCQVCCVVFFNELNAGMAYLDQPSVRPRAGSCQCVINLATGEVTWLQPK